MRRCAIILCFAENTRIIIKKRFLLTESIAPMADIICQITALGPDGLPVTVTLEATEGIVTALRQRNDSNTPYDVTVQGLTRVTSRLTGRRGLNTVDVTARGMLDTRASLSLTPLPVVP